MGRSRRFPKYCRHSSGQAFVERKGKRFYLGTYGSPESELKYHKFLVENADPEAPAPAVVTRSTGVNLIISELADLYIRHARVYYAKNGRPTSEYDALKYAILPLLESHGATRVIEFGPRALKAVREKMVASGLSRRTINYRTGQIRRMFRWGGEEELIPGSVWHDLQQVSGLKKGRTSAKESEPTGPVGDRCLQATLPFLPPVVRDMVNFQRFTGCRPGEVCTLRPCDIERGDDVWVYRPASHKTEHHGKTRAIFIGPQAQAVLKPYLDRDAKSYCFAPEESEKKRWEDRHKARACADQRRKS